MPKSTLLLPFLGGLVGYVAAKMFGVTDGLAIFGIAILCMILFAVGGILMRRRSGN